jgi:hypothetical protein
MRETSLPSEELRQAFAALSASAVAGPDCPSPDAIWEAVRGEASASAAATVVEHTSRCFVCAEAWRLGHEFAGQILPELAAGSSARAFRAPMFGIWASLAAAALLVVAAIGLMLPGRLHQPIVTRAGEESVIVSLVPETTPLPRDAFLLRWSKLADNARYSIRVGTEDLTSIAFQQNLLQPEYQVPSKSLEEIPPGATIIWRVEADLPDGRHMASATFKNKLE